MKVVLCYSGGMDSTVLLHSLVRHCVPVVALSFDYGQRHAKELDFARRNTEKLRVEHCVVDIKSLLPLLRGSALTDSSIAVPEGHYEAESMKQTVVPARNLIFLSLAAAEAVSRGFDTIAIAAHAGDHAIYPDCRPEFVRSIEATIRLATASEIRVFAPYIDVSKTTIARVGMYLEVDFAQTWTCYKGLDEPCGKCGSCVERREALLLQGLG